MHLADGILSGPVLAGGAALSMVGVAWGLRRVDERTMPRVAVLTAAFFVISQMHIPVGPFSTHLVLSGLMGAVLGWAAFPAVLIALLLQAVMFGHGGLTALGVNTLIMAGPAVAVCYLLHLTPRPWRGAFITGCVVGAAAVVGSLVLTAAALLLSGGQFLMFAKLLVVPHVPLVIIEGLITGSALVFLHRLRPEMLQFHLTHAVQTETAHG